MRHIERDFSLKAWVRVRWVDLGVGAEAKIKLFSEYGLVAYQIKADDAGYQHSRYFAHRHTLDLGGGVKRSNYIFFLKRAMLHIKLKLTTLAATW